MLDEFAYITVCGGYLYINELIPRFDSDTRGVYFPVVSVSKRIRHLQDNPGFLFIFCKKNLLSGLRYASRVL